MPVITLSGDSGYEWSSKSVRGTVMMAKPFPATQLVPAISTLIPGTNPHWIGWSRGGVRRDDASIRRIVWFPGVIVGNLIRHLANCAVYRIGTFSGTKVEMGVTQRNAGQLGRSW
jgi:hypothetical protein